MKKDFLTSRLLIVLLAAGAVTNCGQNARTVRTGNLMPVQARDTLTGADTSRNGRTVNREATTDQCPYGGKVNVRYDDVNGNGQLDPGDQVRDTTIYCNGAPGQLGYTIISREIDPSQQTCPNGGVGFMQFIGRRGDTTYDPGKGDKLVGVTQTKCFDTPGTGHRAFQVSIGMTPRRATPVDCPLSGGKGDVVQYYMDLNNDGKFEPSQGETTVAEVAACAAPKNIASVSALTQNYTSAGSCTLSTFTPPAPSDGSAPATQVAIKSCNSTYVVGLLDTTPDTKTCPSGGVMLAAYLDEDHDGHINTAAERASALDPLPLCYGKANANLIATAVNHVTSLPNQCPQSGGAGTTFTTFLSRDGSGIYKATAAGTPADVVLNSFSACDSLDGTPVTGAPVILPEMRAATADELKLGHCPGTTAAVTESRLFPSVNSLQSWLKDKADQDNQGQLLGDTNIICTAPPSNSQQGSPVSPRALVTPGTVRTATSILPALDDQCSDGSKWFVTLFKDHAGTGIFDQTADGPSLYAGCVNAMVARAQPRIDGTHSELHLSKIESTADFPYGGYTVSVYRSLSKGQALEGAEHEDYAIVNGAGSRGSALNLIDLNSYQWADPRNAPKESCEGVALVNFYDTVGDGVYSPGKTPVLNEFAICDAQERSVHLRPSRATDKGCEANAGVVFESFLDTEHAGKFVEGDPISETVPYCPPAAVQPPATAEQDCVTVEETIEGRVTKLSDEELSSPELRTSLPYKLRSGKIGVATYGMHMTSPDGTNFLKDTQSLYRVSFGLPSQDSIKDLKSIAVSMTLAGVRSMTGASHTGTDLFCLLDGDYPECSGERYSGQWEKLLNPEFWKDLPHGLANAKGAGKYSIESQAFSKRILGETKLSSENMHAFKYIPGMEIGLADMFPELDQARFLYSGVGNTGTREFLVEIADDTYASMLRFEARMKLPVCRNAVPPKTDALLAAATNGS